MTAGAIGLIRVGGSDVAVTRLAFGCARIFSGKESHASARLIEAALAVGIRHFDTAPSYSGGQSEELLGSVLAGIPDVTIATKVGIPSGDAGTSPLGTLYRRAVRPVLAQFPGLKSGLLRLARRAQRPGAAHQVATDIVRRELTRDEILRELDGSLARLRRARVDLLMVHEPDRLQLTAAAQETFADLQRQGLIGAFGLAWDRAVPDPPPFGQVVQARYDAEATLPLRLETRLFHGVMRHAGGRQLAAVDRVRHAYMRHPASSIVFSASHPSQIREIVQQATAQCH